jgi:hypothetical protein
MFISILFNDNLWAADVLTEWDRKLYVYKYTGSIGEETAEPKPRIFCIKFVINLLSTSNDTERMSSSKAGSRWWDIRISSRTNIRTCTHSLMILPITILTQKGWTMVSDITINCIHYFHFLLWQIWRYFRYERCYSMVGYGFRRFLRNGFPNTRDREI